MSLLPAALQEYRSLGFKMHDAGVLLPRFVRLLAGRQASYITTHLALEWAQDPSVQPAE